MCIATTNDHVTTHAIDRDVRPDHAREEPVVGDTDTGDEAGRGTQRFGPATLLGVVIWLAILYLVTT